MKDIPDKGVAELYLLANQLMENVPPACKQVNALEKHTSYCANTTQLHYSKSWNPGIAVSNGEKGNWDIVLLEDLFQSGGGFFFVV